MKSLLRNTLLLLAAAGMSALPTKAFAHQVQTNYILGSQGSGQSADTMELRTTFSNGEPLKGAKVSVYAPDQSFRPYTTGVTDNYGRFIFTPDEAISGDWEVNIRRDGHGDILRVPVSNEGIEVDEMAQVGRQDVHFASSPLTAAASVGIAAACIGFARWNKRRSAQ